MALSDFSTGVQGRLQEMIAQRLQQEELAKRDALQQAQLQMQQQRMAQDASQFDAQHGLAREKFSFDQEQAQIPDPVRPVTLGQGQSLVDPSTGRLITSVPSAPERPMSVAPGGSLVDPSSGRIIASMPDRPTKPERSIEDVLAEYEAKKKIDAQYTGSRPSLGAERNTLNYFNRMLEAERNARSIEEALGEKDLAVQQWAPGALENWLQSDEGQRYTQAQRMFTEARLRKESGAAIPPQEFETDRKTNFRITGDTPEVVKQKRAARLQTIRGIGNASGRALQEYYGDDASLDALLKEFDVQQQQGGGGTVRMRAPNGQEKDVPADQVEFYKSRGAALVQ